MRRSSVVLPLLALLAAACSSHGGTAGDPGSAGGGKGAANSAARIGDTLNLTRTDGSEIAVTLTEVINPATPVSGGGHDQKRYVAAKLTITDRGDAAIEGAVNVNASVIGSDNQRYVAELASDVTECTNFDSGIYHLSPGESTTGCVVFALPAGVTPARVRYTPSEGFASDSGEWLIS